MGHAVTCDELICELSDLAGIESSTVVRSFDPAPTDFPVVVTERLPFGVQRLGMSGLTLRGRVYLHTSSFQHSPLSTLLLLRHEAEHVRQQRQTGPAFYLRYAVSWAAAFVFGHGLRSKPEGEPRARWLRAYDAIPYEHQARAAEQRFFRALRVRG